MNKIYSSLYVYLFFFLYSFTFGMIFPRIGDLQIQMGIGESYLGLALSGLPIGVQIALLFADKILSLFNFRIAVSMSITILGFFLFLASFSNEPWSFFIFLLFAGFAVGIVEVAVNIEADRVEFKIRKKIMNRSHSFWSLGFFSAGLLGAIFSQLNVTPTLHFLFCFVLALLLVFHFTKKYEVAPTRPTLNEKPSLFVIPSNKIMALVFFTLSAMLIEGAGIDWSVIFMRDIFNTPPFINGMALFLGAAGQFIVRFNADNVVERFGSKKVAKLSISVMFIGLIFVSFSNFPYLVLFGFFLMGGGTAVLFPLAVSAAAQFSDKTAAANVASLAQISFIVFLIGPPFLGYIAETYGIRISFMICFPLLFLSWVFISSIDKKNDYG